MNEQDILRRLAATAGMQAPPMVDVTGWVLRDLALARRRRVEPALKWFAAVAAAAAVIVTGAAAGAWVQWQDPLAELFRATAVIP
jgi:hypothetical protein